MLKKLTTIMLSIFVSLMLSHAAFAEDVYVTKHGKKYHKKESRFIKGKEVEKLTIEEAIERGYKPSSDFAKDDKEGKAE